MVKRQRVIQLHFMVSPEERGMINEKMASIGTKNMGAYLRKMAVDGLIIHLHTADVRELV
ncbi:plasmid mobilization protein, partial [Vallitalea sediminicola]